ncbi:ankyrin repeat domain-containing protein [Endozoicomonas sp. YOMI1]|uniref:ankyrin repeat domain-containing protein n=1 Tax=Endozoicomonas sp. YOMI1 TaxID=2828739 RepID=UPI002147AE9D|nr:ankyrin repeat domain-containing protein [Endozoicomonas sp. YOMI1]
MSPAFLYVYSFINIYGNTALHVAACKGNIGSLKELLTNAAVEVNTPLHQQPEECTDMKQPRVAIGRLW